MEMLLPKSTSAPKLALEYFFSTSTSSSTTRSLWFSMASGMPTLSAIGTQTSSTFSALSRQSLYCCRLVKVS